MKARLLMVVMIGLLFIVGSAFARMGGGNMGPGGGEMGPGRHMGGGIGSGMMGAGSMVSDMMGNTISYGYQDILEPTDTPDEARLAIQAFLDFSNSGLQISELWEYATVYKAELSDAAGAKAFDLIVDKFTGAVSPEMGFSMMMNASYGKGLYNVPKFRKNLAITPDQATSNAQDFVAKNGLGYTLVTPPEVYPGYYRFHTTLTSGTSSSLGMDIMVNGYNGGIWINTLYGLPVAQH
jgi:hypothetical protein